MVTWHNEYRFNPANYRILVRQGVKRVYCFSADSYYLLYSFGYTQVVAELMSRADCVIYAKYKASKEAML